MCGQSGQAAAKLLGHAPSERVVSGDRADIVCRLRRGRLKIRVEAQASTQPWVEYDTTQVHFVQAFSGLHDRSELPVNVTGVGTQAIWVPGQGELVTTNASQSSAGSYLTVNVSHVAPGGPSARQLAAKVGAAALKVAPSGPKPGAPPA